MMIEETMCVESGDCITFKVYPDSAFDYPYEIYLNDEGRELSEKEVNELIKHLQWMKRANRVTI